MGAIAREKWQLLDGFFFGAWGQRRFTAWRPSANRSPPSLRTLSVEGLSHRRSCSLIDPDDLLSLVRPRSRYCESARLNGRCPDRGGRHHGDTMQIRAALVIARRVAETVQLVRWIAMPGGGDPERLIALGKVEWRVGQPGRLRRCLQGLRPARSSAEPGAVSAPRLMALRRLADQPPDSPGSLCAAVWPFRHPVRRLWRSV